RSPFIEIMAGYKSSSVSVLFRIAFESQYNFTHAGQNYFDSSIFSVSLASFQAYEISLCLVDNKMDFSGSKVSADSPIGVISGSCSFKAKCSDGSKTVDMAVEMNVPVQLFSATAHINPTYSMVKNDTLMMRIGTAITSTSVCLGEGLPQNGELSRKELFSVWNATQVTNTKQAYLTQTYECEEMKCPLLSLVTPREFFFHRYIFSVPSVNSVAHFVLLVKLTSDTLTLDGTNITSVNWMSMSSVDVSGYLAVGDGLHEATSLGKSPFGCYLYGNRINDHAAYMHHAGLKNLLKYEDCEKPFPVEKNDLLDDDCDRLIDEEKLDDIDNDLDGRVDEDLGPEVNLMFIDYTEIQSHCIDNASCAIWDRICLLGCVPGYIGPCCFKVHSPHFHCIPYLGLCFHCLLNYYGSYCNKRCSPGCADNVFCHRDKGTCACREGYYGETCLKIGFPNNKSRSCYCADGNCSESDGSCLSTNRCIVGRFGLSCQYKDKAQDALLEAIEEADLLVDNDDSTCVNVTNNTINAFWTEFVRIEWFRLVFFTEDSSRNFEIKYVGPNQTYPCSHPVVLYPHDSNRTVDIICKVSYNVKSITVSWSGDTTICSYYFSGGRTLAFLSVIDAIIQTPKDINKTRTTAMTDGDFTSCLTLNSSTRLELWFPNHIIVSEIVIYIDFNQTDDFKNFAIAFIDGNVKVYNATTSMEDMFVQRVVLQVSITVTTLEISVVSGSQRVCELEVIGVCQAPNTGFRCEQHCNQGCKDNACDYNGTCYECIGERYGRSCSDVQVYLASGIAKKPFNFWPLLLLLLLLLLLILLLVYSKKKMPVVQET
ncbi:laminin subunit alpha-like isoform X3, partial [Biomphalaria pfeifferi]